MIFSPTVMTLSQFFDNNNTNLSKKLITQPQRLYYSLLIYENLTY